MAVFRRMPLHAIQRLPRPTVIYRSPLLCLIARRCPPFPDVTTALPRYPPTLPFQSGAVHLNASRGLQEVIIPHCVGEGPAAWPPKRVQVHQDGTMIDTLDRCAINSEIRQLAVHLVIAAVIAVTFRGYAW